jgi:hypothetical protein
MRSSCTPKSPASTSCRSTRTRAPQTVQSRRPNRTHLHDDVIVGRREIAIEEIIALVDFAVGPRHSTDDSEGYRGRLD